MAGLVMVSKVGGCGGGGNGKSSSSSSSKGGGERKNHHQHHQQQLSLLEFLLTALRKSMVSCRVDQQEEAISAVHQMEIGWPTNVQHITHVTFDRFHGFLGLPVEFEVEVPCRAPSARFFFSFFVLSRDFLLRISKYRGEISIMCRSNVLVDWIIFFFPKFYVCFSEVHYLLASSCLVVLSIN